MVVNSWKDKFRHHFEEVLATKTSSHHIALGFAIGSFIAILPTPGFSILIGLIVILLFKKLNKYALFAAIIIWNPFVQIPIYYLNVALGNLLFASSEVVKFDVSFASAVYHYTRRYLVGSVISATVFSALSYGVVYVLARKYRLGKLIKTRKKLA